MIILRQIFIPWIEYQIGVKNEERKKLRKQVLQWEPGRRQKKIGGGGQKKGSYVLIKVISAEISPLSL